MNNAGKAFQDNKFFSWFMARSVAMRYFLLVVVFPTIVAVIYYGFIASDIYIAEAKYALRVNSDTPSVSFFESMISSGSGVESANEDAGIVRDFIHSREMIRKLDETLSIRTHYSSGDIDFLSRFDPDASAEEFLAYFQKNVAIGIDTTTNISTLKVRAFDAGTAHDIAEAIIDLSEELINTLSNRMVEDSLQFARGEVENAETRVRHASEALTTFRTRTNSINPGEETSAVLGIITGLESQLAAARTQLIEAQSYMQRSSPQVQMLRGKVEALEKQVEDERKRLSSNESSDTDYTRLIDSYEPLVLEQELATKQYASALSSLELARFEAQKKQRYLLPFVPPQTPDEAIEPERIKSIATVFLATCVLYAIGCLVWAAVKDHMRI